MLNLSESEREVVRKVIEDMQRSCGIFRGKHDTRNRYPAFMNGVATTMEAICYYVGEDYAEEQDRKFVENMIESEQRAKGKRKKKEWWKLWSK